MEAISLSDEYKAPTIHILTASVHRLMSSSYEIEYPDPESGGEL